MRVFSRLLAALLGWTLLVLCGPSSPAAAAPDAAREPESSKVGGRRNSLGELTAPDEVSAKAIARLTGERVEVVGARSEFSSSWALPDGSLSSGVAAGPVRVQVGGEGEELEDWLEIDLDLVAGSDGWVRPKGHMADLKFAGKSALSAETVVMMSDRGRSEDSLSLGWSGLIPEPTLAGPRATYAEVFPGVDLVLEATRTGFEQYFVLKRRPADGVAPKLTLPLRASGRYALRTDREGGASVVVGDEEAARVGVPLVWDSRLDLERTHPVTQPWKWPSPELSGLARSLGAQPDWKDALAPDLRSPEVAPVKQVERERRPADMPAPTDEPKPAVKPGRLPEGVAVPHLQPPLVLPDAVQVGSEREARVDLTVDREFLSDPDTVFPVVIDPDLSFNWGFDTWVSKEWMNTDKSTSPFLRVGGSAGWARSFIHFDFQGIAGKQILDSRLHLWENYSYSCQARNWEIWDTAHASTATRWGNQPAWWTKWAVSSETTGYSSSCADDWVSIGTQSMMQWLADINFSGVFAVGLNAQTESDAYALKEFNSANAGWSIPVMWVNYNSRPTASTDLAVTPSTVVDGVIYTNNPKPELSAVGHDADGGELTFVFRLHNGVNGPQVWEATRTGTSGQTTAISVGTNGGILQEGANYGYIVHTVDPIGAWNTANSGWKQIVADFTPPPAPLSISSTAYPANGPWSGGVGVSGTFDVALGSGEANPHGFIWAVDGPPLDTNRVAGNQLSYTPTTAGRHVLNVRAIDKAGNVSPMVSHTFNVAPGGIVSPMEGTRVVRRARLEVQAASTSPKVRFEWRAGPDSAGVHPVPKGVLTTAAGTPFAAEQITLSAMGSYATLDAGLLLGFRMGPFQVRPVFAPVSGPEVPGAWVSLFVDPDADGAAGDGIGPGSVNLVTGDYTLSGEDADEFGITVGRTASSRDPRAGLKPQKEILSVGQRTISDITGFTSVTSSFSKVTDRWHAGNDGLRVIPTAEGNNTFVAVGGDVGGMRLGLTPGRTYRFSGWAYVPAATGLSPDHVERGLRLAAFSKVGAAPYTWTLSQKVAAVDSWQYLSVDFTVPDGATEAFIRAYNGFNAGSGKEVFYDDLSLRELWAPLGPQWALGVADDAAGTDYERVEKPDAESTVIHTDGGGEIWFTKTSGGTWVPEVGAEGLVLTSEGNDWVLTELDGTVSRFVPAAPGGPAMISTTQPSAAADATNMEYEVVDGLARVRRIIAPTEEGLSPASCKTGTPARGCEVTEFTYAAGSQAKPASGTVGLFPRQLSQVGVWSTDPATGVVSKQTVAEYRYDSEGRLTETWDPRVSPALKTVYAYDAAGHVITMTPAGELPWRFAYAASGERTSASGDLIDSNPGRLQSVTRASLAEGSASTIGPDNTTTVLYGVPLSRATGGPYNLDSTALATWAQKGAPTDATAVFGPHAPPPTTTVSPTSPGPDGYQTATVHYLDASGREVNTASPIGGTGVDTTLKQTGYIDSAEFDQYGNTTRTLDATNRLMALGLGPTAAADLLELNLTGLTTAERALRLSSLSTYSYDGLDLLTSIGPAQRVTTATGPQVVRLRTVNVYDEGKPDGQAYHLVTTSTTSAQPIAFPNDPTKSLDVVVTRTGYAPTAQLGGTSGWTVKKPTSVTVGEGAEQVSSQIKYDVKGRVLESRRPALAGVADWGTKTIYYTVGVNSDDATCGGRPEWAGQACVSKPTGTIQGTVPARMGNTLPTRRIEQYSRYGTPLLVTETSTGPGAQQRTTTTTLDAAERVSTVAITVSGAGASTAVETVTTTYNSTSGHAVQSTTSQGTIVRTLDKLGRTMTYKDVSGATASSVYDRYGQPKTYTEKDAAGTTIGTRTFTYDRNLDPRGYLTSIADSVAGTISATYGADGQVLTETLPGGVSLALTYDATRTPTSRTYSYNNQVVASSTVTTNTAGKWATHNTTASSSTYVYDALGRLTGAQQAINGTCTWRQYDFNTRSDRTAKRSKTIAGGCPAITGAMGTPTQTIGYTYDSADRLVSDTSGSSQPWAYDGLGRMTAYRSALAPNTTVSAVYYDNDRIKSQTTPDGASIAWSLDPIARFNTITTTPAGGGTATVKQNHYTDDSDSPAWISENTSDPNAITRYVDGIDGQLALATGKTGGRILQLVDLHGDIMGTLPIADGTNGTATIGLLVLRANDEYGLPLNLTTGGVSANAPPRYGYLGGEQRSAETLGGTLLMGSRVYQPAIGRFTSLDSEPGGNASDYDYVHSDPVNNTDLTGNWPDWKSVLGTVAKVAEIGSMIPGPVGTAFAIAGVGSYALRGDGKSALRMGLTAAANMVGCGLVVGAAFKIAGRAAGIGRAAQGVAKATRSKEGIYITLTRRGQLYVGQSRNINRRLSQHVRSNKITPLQSRLAIKITVKGGKARREVAEQRMINRLGGIGGRRPGLPRLENLRNPIGAKRQHLFTRFPRDWRGL